ncbi:MAG TPA: DPP IV N-terminal domain-containing protein [Gemmatimonadaceae bacterium]|nr:DPP IV N-terminal domain-containing protein [Gemmatimonadaceae bacterium]
MPTSPPRRSGAVLLLALAIAGACTSKGDGGTGPVNNPAIALSLSPTSASVPQGGMTTVTGTITRSGGFSGDVLLTTTGNPAGVTPSVGNITTSGGITTATIPLQVGAAVPTGTYTITVTATGSGVTAATATFTLTVTQGGSYTMVAAPTALSLAPGGSAPVTLTFVFTNLTAGVALTLEAPTGVTGITGVFNPPSPVTGPTTTLTVTVGAAVAPGTYPLTVRGKVAGLADVTAAISLTVVAQSYTLSLMPPTLSIAQGGSATTTVTLNRTNFTGPVALTLEAPAGVTGITGTFNPTPAAAAATGAKASGTANAVTSTTSTLTVTVASTVAPGVYALKVRSKNAALADVTADLSLTVVAGVIANGKIAFKDGSDAIWTVNPDGTGLLQLTPGFPLGAACTAADEEPRWSPDGTKIVFTRTKDGSQDIWVMNADGSGQTRLTNDGDGKCEDDVPNRTWSENPSWSPDGRKIIFTSARASGGFVEALWIMNADGTGQTLLLSMAGSLVSEAFYSPDGRSIAFHVEPIAPTPALQCDGIASGGEIWVMNADGTNKRRLTTTANCSFDENLSWSPDSRKIAFGRCAQLSPAGCGVGGEEIFIMNSDGTNQIQLTSNFAGFNSERPSFSPDGTKILFANGANGDSIWFMNVDGSAKVPVGTGAQSAGQPSWQPVFRPTARR